MSKKLGVSRRKAFLTVAAAAAFPAVRTASAAAAATPNTDARDAVQTSAAFQKFWEKPNAAGLANFFAVPCAIKTGHGIDMITYSTEEEVQAFAKIAGGKTTWKWDTLSQWVWGSVVVGDVWLRRSPDVGKQIEAGKATYLVEVKDGKIRHWFSYNYLDASYPEYPSQIARSESGADEHARVTASVVENFQKAWEKPDAEALASFFSYPCSLKMFDWPLAQHFKEQKELAAIFQANGGARSWRADPARTLVGGRCLIRVVRIDSSSPNGGKRVVEGVVGAIVRDGKIRQWLEFE